MKAQPCISHSPPAEITAVPRGIRAPASPSLFAELCLSVGRRHGGPNLLPRAGAMYLFRDAIVSSDAEMQFEKLQRNISFQREIGLVYGMRRPFPRDTAWFGAVRYQYSGVSHPPVAMLPCLLPLKDLVENLAGCSFNGVLLNLYRDGNDSVSWHADDKPEIRHGSAIANLSFGATRRFMVKHRTEPGLRLALDLTAGSYLIMAGLMQQHWLHCVPKVRHSEPRISLTFRQAVVSN